MHNLKIFLIALIPTIILVYIEYLAWFSPKGYAKLIVWWKKWIKATSIFYWEEYIDFMLSTSGFGLWFMRISLLLGIFLSLRALLFGLFGWW
jgi:hypothetical protein